MVHPRHPTTILTIYPIYLTMCVFCWANSEVVMKIMIVVIALVGCGQEPTGHIRGPREVARLIADSTRQFQEAKIFLTQSISDIRQMLEAIDKMRLTEKREKIQLIRRILRFDTDAIKKMTNRGEVNAQVKHQLDLARQWQEIKLELTQADSIVSGVLDELHQTKLMVDKRMHLLLNSSGHTVADYGDDALLKIEDDAIHQLIDQEQINVGKLINMIDESLANFNVSRKLLEKKLNKLQGEEL